MKNKPHISLQRKYLLVLLAAWLFVQFLLLLKYGIVTDKEAIKYSREANNFLLNKSFSEQKYIFYSVYIFIHSIFIKLGCETQGVYIFQLLANLFSTFLFYQTASRLYKNINAAFIAALLLIICFSWQYWTICLYTESFFCSMMIIFTYCLFGMNKKVKLKYVYSIVTFCILLFARPTGILLIPVLSCMIIYKLFESKKILAAILCIALLSTTFFYFLYYEMNSAASFDFVKPFIERNIICDVSDRTITLLNNSYTDDSNGLLLYIKQNPADFLRLCGLRFLAFWGLSDLIIQHHTTCFYNHFFTHFIFSC